MCNLCVHCVFLCNPIPPRLYKNTVCVIVHTLYWDGVISLSTELSNEAPNMDASTN